MGSFRNKFGFGFVTLCIKITTTKVTTHQDNIVEQRYAILYILIDLNNLQVRKYMNTDIICISIPIFRNISVIYFFCPFRFDMASNLCLLCLQRVVADTGEQSDGEKYKRKIKIATLCELLAPTSSYHGQFDDDEVCGFCQDCYPVFGEVEEIRKQISILEGQVERKIVQIKETISISSPPLLDGSGDRIMEIRNFILRVTHGAGEINIVTFG